MEESTVQEKEKDTVCATLRAVLQDSHLSGKRSAPCLIQSLTKENCIAGVQC